MLLAEAPWTPPVPLFMLPIFMQPDTNFQGVI